jgi:hypothetical protein
MIPYQLAKLVCGIRNSTSTCSLILTLAQVSDYAGFVTNLPLREAFFPPIFDHPAVLAAWKDGFLINLYHCSTEELTVLTTKATKEQIEKIVQERASTWSRTGLSRTCTHSLVSEERCMRCQMELSVIVFLDEWFIAEANLSPQAAFAPDHEYRIAAHILALFAEMSWCESCHNRGYVACLCTFIKVPNGYDNAVLLEWSKKNKSLEIDITFYFRYLDFLMRQIELESCLVCHENEHNIRLPLEKRICFCDRVCYCFPTYIVRSLIWSRMQGALPSSNILTRTSVPEWMS